MLAFIDESYQETDIAGIYYTTYSAACLSQDKSRTFSRDLCNLKRTLWKVDDPADKEMKGREILSEYAIVLPKNREFVEQVQALLRLHEVRIFAIVTKGSARVAQEQRLPAAVLSALD